MNLGEIQNEISESFYFEENVSTLLNIKIVYKEQENQENQENILNELLTELNNNCFYKREKISFNFIGENGVYCSKITYGNYVKFKVVKDCITKFNKKYPRVIINWVLSTPVFFPEKIVFS